MIDPITMIKIGLSIGCVILLAIYISDVVEKKVLLRKIKEKTLSIYDTDEETVVFLIEWFLTKNGFVGGASVFNLNMILIAELNNFLQFVESKGISKKEM